MQSRETGRLVFEVVVSDDQGEETTIELPGKHEVCARCEGFGTHLNPSIGEHAYTPEEFDEAFHDDEQRAAYFTRGGHYDVPCGACRGARVVVVADEQACSVEQLETLARYRAEQNDRAREEAEDRRTMRRESGQW